jgi:eukaryotic-like serine/threonine-protein kinase
MTLQVGEVIRDRYRILCVLASGGMGIVYLAKDESLGVDVAVKESLPGMRSEAQIKRNAILLGSLHHPAIPRITDAFETESSGQILVMDFIPGEDLKSHIDKYGPSTVGDAVAIITSIGSALQYLHNQEPPIIHQDVKPGNIRITPDGNVMLIDFDLATALQDNQTRPSSHEQGLTPGFAAPEQYNQMASPASDQYGLAATLFFVLTASMLPDGITRATGDSKLPERAANRIPLDILTCLKKALQVNSSDRYPNIQSFLDALSSILKTQPEITSITTRNQRYTRPLPRRKSFLPIAVVFLGFVAVGTAALLLINFPAGKERLSQGTQTETVSFSGSSSSGPIKTESPLPVIQSTSLPSTETVFVKPSKPTPLGSSSGIYAFVSENTGVPQVFLGTTSSSAPGQLTNVAEGACQPDWSPDGKKIVFVSPCLSKSQLVGKTEPYNGSGLFILSVDGKQVIPIPSQPGGDFEPAWSPGGNQIAFTSTRAKFPQVFIFDLLTDVTTQLTDTTGGNRQPAWSPDGKRLAISSYRKGSFQIWMIDTSGGNPAAFSVQNNGAAYSADWSPDGKDIVYSQTNSLRLVSKNAVSPDSVEAILNPRLTGASNPDVSPDGNWILFDSNLGGKFQVYRISKNGSGVEPITPADETAYQPVWKPAIQD